MRGRKMFVLLVVLTAAALVPVDIKVVDTKDDPANAAVVVDSDQPTVLMTVMIIARNADMDPSVRNNELGRTPSSLLY